MLKLNHFLKKRIQQFLFFLINLQIEPKKATTFNCVDELGFLIKTIIK